MQEFGVISFAYQFNAWSINAISAKNLPKILSFFGVWLKSMQHRVSGVLQKSGFDYWVGQKPDYPSRFNCSY
jgi:hypothetical protein